MNNSCTCQGFNRDLGLSWISLAPEKEKKKRGREIKINHYSDIAGCTYEPGLTSEYFGQGTWVLVGKFGYEDQGK